MTKSIFVSVSGDIFISLSSRYFSIKYGIKYLVNGSTGFGGRHLLTFNDIFDDVFKGLRFNLTDDAIITESSKEIVYEWLT